VWRDRPFFTCGISSNEETDEKFLVVMVDGPKTITKKNPHHFLKAP
jgi:hypothetical protein